MQQRRHIAEQAQGHLAAALAWMHQHGVNQRPQCFGCGQHGLRIGQGFLQRLDLAAVQRRQIRVQHRHGLRQSCGDNLGLQRLPAALNLPQFVRHGRTAMAVFDQFQQVADLPVELGCLRLQPGLAGAALAIDRVNLGHVGGHEFLDEFRREQPLLEADQHPDQDRVARHRAAVRAGSALHMVRAAQPAWTVGG
ncbi:hypothetical protein [Falsiroseomonas stagni]|uniref:hypothetical protein n=1 Tax=Falsiroseomonas stagni TaxID=484882 RepID=UPI000B8A421D|nr:hypothetical protein [Falsiroseomonas stagni]